MNEYIDQNTAETSDKSEDFFANSDDKVNEINIANEKLLIPSPEKQAVPEKQEKGTENSKKKRVFRDKYAQTWNSDDTLYTKNAARVILNRRVDRAYEAYSRLKELLSRLDNEIIDGEAEEAQIMLKMGTNGLSPEQLINA
jgi:hypothetical protein